MLDDLDDVAPDLAKMFKALGDPTRLRLLSRIMSAEGGEICVCDLTADAFDLASPTISHHLKVLREAGLIARDRRSTWLFYRADRNRIAILSALLDVADARSPTLVEHEPEVLLHSASG
jgi:ArsR family transcriptional regulator